MTRSRIQSSIIHRASLMPRFHRPPQHYVTIMARVISEEESDAVVRAVLNGGNAMSSVLWVLTDTAVYELAGGMDPVSSLRVPFEQLGTVVADESPGVLGEGNVDIRVFHTRGVMTSTRCHVRSAGEFRSALERRHEWHLANSPGTPLSCLPVDQVSTAHGLPAAASTAWMLVSYQDRFVLRTDGDATDDVAIGYDTVDVLDYGFHTNGEPTLRIRGAGFDVVAHSPVEPAAIERILRPSSVAIRAATNRSTHRAAPSDQTISLLREVRGLATVGTVTVADLEERQRVLLPAS